MSWNPERYLQFDDLRLRPALDLIGRIPCAAPAKVVDLGCGPGTVTQLLAQRWQDAEVLGVDRSPAMLTRAAQSPTAATKVHWELADAASWRPKQAVDLLFSNAALHWLDDHPTLFASLAGMLTPAGVLAVQMPANFDAPSHRCIRALAEGAAWKAQLGDARMGAILTAAEYWRLLAALFRKVELWETTYWQRLTGAAPVLDWLRGTTLVPYLERLDAAAAAAFVAALQPALEAAYPRETDGSVLFPFRRLFMVSQFRR